MTKATIPYYQQLQPAIAVEQMQVQHTAQLEALQKVIFPLLADDELIQAVYGIGYKLSL